MRPEGVESSHLSLVSDTRKDRDLKRFTGGWCLVQKKGHQSERRDTDPVLACNSLNKTPMNSPRRFDAPKNLRLS